MKCPITKIENPLRNILAPAIIYIILAQFCGALIYGVLFQEIWAPFESVWRPMDQVQYWRTGMLITNAFYGAFISVIFVKLNCFSQKNLNIFAFSLTLFIASRFFGEIYNFLMFPYSFQVALVGIAHGASTMFLWAAISNKIFNIKLK